MIVTTISLMMVESRRCRPARNLSGYYPRRAIDYSSLGRQVTRFSQNITIALSGTTIFTVRLFGLLIRMAKVELLTKRACG